MAKKYGFPYKGSKSGIAEWVIANIPEAHTFVDLFAGGHAVTHCALLSGKWGRIIANDIDPRCGRLFADALAGKFRNETRFISREDFMATKAADGYIAFCWSFGKHGRNYMYGRHLEGYKTA